MPQPTSLRVCQVDEEGERFAIVNVARCATVSLSLDRATLRRLHRDIGEALHAGSPHKFRDPIERWNRGKKLPTRPFAGSPEPIPVPEEP